MAGKRPGDIPDGSSDSGIPGSTSYLGPPETSRKDQAGGGASERDFPGPGRKSIKSKISIGVKASKRSLQIRSRVKSGPQRG